jgi:hypothetical protein
MRQTHRLLATAAIAFALAAGCASTDPGKDATKKDKDGHEHGAGPHGDAVADWGPYHVEFTVDHKTQEATVYVLGDDAKTAAPIKAVKLTLKIKEPPFEVELKPAPQEKDPAGSSSRFVGKHERLGKDQEFEGTITGQVGGKTYSGAFAEEPEEKK